MPIFVILFDMRSPEFNQQLEWARSYRGAEAQHIVTARRSGLYDEARGYLSILKSDPPYQRSREIVVENRWRALGERLPQFPPEVWQETGDTLSALNNGVKAALHIIVAENTIPGTYMPVDDITERFKQTFAGTELLEVFGKTTKQHVIQYCQQSLCDIGLLQAEVNLEGNIIGFWATEKGKKATDLAYLVLAWENQSQQSLYPLLGKTSSSGDTRAAQNRARILYYLARHVKGREADLVTSLGMNHVLIKDSIRPLLRFGLVDYQAVTPHTGKVEVEYIVDTGKNLNEAGYVTDSKSLQDKVIEILQTNPQESSSAEKIRGYLPEDLRNRWKESLSNEINRILSRLAQKGFLTRVSGFKGRETLSNANITQKGRSFVLSFLLPQLLLSQGIALSHLNQHTRDMIERAKSNFTAFARNCAECYYPHSNSSKQRGYQVNKARVIGELGKTSTPLTAGDFAKKFGLSENTIHSYLTPLFKGSDTITIEVGGEQVQIKREVIKGVVYYRVEK